MEAPGDLWQSKASAFVEWAIKNLWGESRKDKPSESAKVREWLMKDRGLDEETIKSVGLGWNPKDWFPTRKSWGLPDKETTEKTVKKIYLPRGLVIPHRQYGHIVKVKIRRPDPGNGQRYIFLAGGDTRPIVIKGKTQKVIIVVESELDGILLQAKAGDLCTCIALGSATNRPDAEADQVLKQAELILVALDGDQAGAKEAWHWWAEHYPNSKRWPPVKGKDPGEMHQAGVDVRLWVQAGLLKETPGQADGNAGKQNKESEGLSICNSDNGQHRLAFIFSKVLQRQVNLSWSADGKTVYLGGVHYSDSEIERLKTQSLKPETLRQIHEVKRTFEGRIETQNMKGDGSK